MDEDKKLRVIIREELKKLSGMTWGQRLGYVWDYYKPLMVALLVIVFAINIGVTIYHSMQQIDVLQVYMVNANAMEVDTEGMAAEFADYIGGLKKNEVITIDASLTENADEMSQYTIASQVKRMALTSTGNIDIMFVPEDVYQTYLEEGMLRSMEDLLSDEQKEEWSDLLLRDSGEVYAVNVQDSEVLERYDAYDGEPVYAVVSVNASHLDICGEFLEYIV